MNIEIGNIKIENEFFGIENTVFRNFDIEVPENKNSLNLEYEIYRYQLIKEYELDSPDGYLYSALNVYTYKYTMLNTIPPDILVYYIDDYTLVEKKEKNYSKVDDYNSKVEKVLSKLSSFRAKLASKPPKIITKFSNKYLTISLENKSGNKFSNISFTIYYPDFPKYAKYKENIFAALLRYDVLGFLKGNISTAVQPKIYSSLSKQGYKVELFGSFFNRFTNYYFGLFYDLEYPFGCLGNLFTSKLNYGKFLANPPFEPNIMNSLMRFLYENLSSNSSNLKLNIYITMPIWYSKDVLSFYEKYGCPKPKIYSTDIEKNLLEKYITKDELYSQKKYAFFNYITGKNLHLCNVNVFEVSN